MIFVDDGRFDLGGKSRYTKNYIPNHLVENIIFDHLIVYTMEYALKGSNECELGYEQLRFRSLDEARKRSPSKGPILALEVNRG